MKAAAVVLLLLALCVSVTAHADGANACQLGGLIAYQAYMRSELDATRPNRERLHWMVDYLGESVPFVHDRTVAHKGVDYLARRLQPIGMRAPVDGVVYEATREFIVKECVNYGR